MARMGGPDSQMLASAMCGERLQIADPGKTMQWPLPVGGRIHCGILTRSRSSAGPSPPLACPHTARISRCATRSGAADLDAAVTPNRLSRDRILIDRTCVSLLPHECAAAVACSLYRPASIVPVVQLFNAELLVGSENPSRVGLLGAPFEEKRQNNALSSPAKV